MTGLPAPPYKTSALLSRYMWPDWDAAHMPGSWLRLVDPVFNTASPQHHARRWEYAMGLCVLAMWRACGYRSPLQGLLALDVGGAGSPFPHMLSVAGLPAIVVDPVVPADDPASAIPNTIEQYSLAGSAPPHVDAIFSISTIEHVEDPVRFLQACAQVLLPGGLLFITTDAWDKGITEPDAAHWHWLRERIYCPESLEHLVVVLQGMGMALLGEKDFTWRGAVLDNWGYSFASITMVKK